MDKKAEIKLGERLVEGKTSTAVPATRAATLTETLTGNLEQTAETLMGLDKLTLHEERAKVDILKESAGAVSVRKVLKERTETIPVTLVSEVLEITVNHSGTGKVLLDGQPLEVGRTYEVLLQDERATIQKEVYPVAEINLRKRAHTVTHTEEVTLRREELDVQGDQALVHEVVTETKI